MPGDCSGAMVVFTSGIVDGQLLACSGFGRSSGAGWSGLVTHCLTLVGDGVKHTVGS